MGVTGATTLINAKSNSVIKFQKANRVESISNGEKKVETDSNIQESARTKLVNPERDETISNAKSNSGRKESQQTEAESDSRQPSPHSNRVGQLTPSTEEKVVSPQPSLIIANNLNGEQEEKLLEVLKKHKKAIGWTLVDLPRINPSICMQ
ncbi:hypothetical protein CR513_09548, partial [Mucuna pruriens]